MSLMQWFDNGWLRQHKTSRQEVANLLALVRRDLQDATSMEISNDWRFGIAYNAVLKVEFATDLSSDVMRWLERSHPDLL